jgi:hypothetical protein
MDVGFDANVSQEPAASILTVEESVGWLHCGRQRQLTSADLGIEPELDS